jgi:hypothetical protein
MLALQHVIGTSFFEQIVFALLHGVLGLGESLAGICQL